MSRRPVRVSEAGAVLLATESAISASLSHAAAELAALASGEAGEVRLGAFISAAASLAPPALARLRSLHPGVRITLHEIEQSQAYPALLRGDIDLAITFDYQHAPDPAPDGIAQRHLMDDPILAVLPADHQLATVDSIDPADIPADTWIHTDVDDAGVTRSPEPSERAPRHQLNFQGGDFRTALNLVAAGLGAALLPQLLLHELPAGVAVLPLRRPRLLRRLYTCRLDTTRTTTSIERLETYLQRTAAGSAPHDP